MVEIALIPNDFYTPDVGFEDVIALCEKEGVKFIEIAFLWDKSILDLDGDELSRVHEILDRHGVKVASIQTQIMKVFPEGSKLAKAGSKNMHRDHQYNVSMIDAAIDRAKEFDTKYIVTYSYFTYLSKVDDALWDRLFEDYDRLASACKAAGRTMVLECEGDTVIGSTADYLRLFDHINSPHLKANLDLSNFVGHCGDFTEEDFEKLKDHVEYFHVKDRLNKKSVLQKLPVIGHWFKSKAAVFGEGNVPWRRVLPWFIDGGYDGTLSVEPHVHGKDKYELGVRCVKNLQQYLVELGIDFQ